MSEPVFRVLHVCTGNICRSPMAASLMRAGLAARLGTAASRFVVESAGTLGRPGAPMEPYAVDALAGLGVPGEGHRARELAAPQVAAADLVLAAAREHRAAAVVLHPRASRWTFTLREFARLAGAVDPAGLPDGDPVERARALVVAAAALRGVVQAQDPADDDVVDPYRGPAEGFAACAALVRGALEVPLGVVAGAGRA